MTYCWSNPFLIAFAVFFVKGHLKVYNKGNAFFASTLKLNCVEIL